MANQRSNGSVELLLSEQAHILYQTVDTIVDHHNADDRLDNLEASHSGSGI